MVCMFLKCPSLGCIPWLQLRGQTVESFVAEAQDKTRSALAKSLEAAYLAWEEQVRGDEIKFDAESLRSLPQLSTEMCLISHRINFMLSSNLVF